MITYIIGRNVLRVGDPLFIAIAAESSNERGSKPSDGVRVAVRRTEPLRGKTVERAVAVARSRAGLMHAVVETADLPPGTYELTLHTSADAEVGIGEVVQLLDSMGLATLSALAAEESALPPTSIAKIRDYVHGLWRERLMPIEALRHFSAGDDALITVAADTAQWRVHESLVLGDPGPVMMAADALYDEIAYVSAAGAHGLELVIYRIGDHIVFSGLMEMPRESAPIRRYAERDRFGFDRVDLELRGEHLALLAQARHVAQSEEAAAPRREEAAASVRDQPAAQQRDYVEVETSTAKTNIVGIDLGTTYSVVAVMEGQRATVIPNSEGSHTTPSVVAFTKTGERLVGQLAKRQAVVNAEGTISSVKRYMGTDHRIAIGDKEYTPQEISSMILQKLVADASTYLGERVSKAVITVPAYFDDAQRQATKDAGKIAGLEVVRIINEPTAAALADGLDKKGNETVLVWDLGGGTFDVSIVEVGDGIFEVKSTNGDTHLGGDDYDARIVEWLVSEFHKDQEIDISSDRQTLQRLTEAAEKAKIELTDEAQTSISLPFITADQNGPKHLEMTLTRAKFEELTQDLTDRCVQPFRNALADAGLEVSQIDDVVMVGGSTRMPVIQELVIRLTGKGTDGTNNRSELVAIGAAIQAAVLAGNVRDVVLLDVTPVSLGLETLGGVFTKLIDRNTTIPTRRLQVFTTAEDGQTSVDVRVLQGEREMANDNKELGRFRLEGIPAAPRGVAQVEVTFSIDVNGIVKVSARDLGSGKEQALQITGSANLSKEDVDRMMRDAAAFATADKAKKEDAEIRNTASSLIYSAEKSLKEAGAQIKGPLRAALEAAIEQCKTIGEKGSVDEIKAATENLRQAMYEMAEELYQPKARGGPFSEEAPTSSDVFRN